MEKMSTNTRDVSYPNIRGKDYTVESGSQVFTLRSDVTWPQSLPTCRHKLPGGCKLQGNSIERQRQDGIRNA